MLQDASVVVQEPTKTRSKRASARNVANVVRMLQNEPIRLYEPFVPPRKRQTIASPSPGVTTPAATAVAEQLGTAIDAAPVGTAGPSEPAPVQGRSGGRFVRETRRRAPNTWEMLHPDDEEDDEEDPKPPRKRRAGLTTAPTQAASNQCPLLFLASVAASLSSSQDP